MPARPPTGGEAAAPAGAPEIALQNAARWPELRRHPLRRWLGGLLGEVAPGARSLGVRFCGDRAMREWNRDFRGRDEVTDVLSFPGDESPAFGTEGAAHLGDVVVCVPQARRQARERRGTTEGELAILLLHGGLHCAGYDHETDDGEMERIERRLRRRWVLGSRAPFGLPAGSRGRPSARVAR